ncbi:MAG: multicopper oxidase domain-containing protein [Armatimonadota bacterium]|nr:multicopper oxidase domain-containing protein [Armatimonadota bacterium]MDR7519094.1 multicopper oxidase domain-containing protein [Armatimonadota bacterium]MDR7548977.1 multicopper oxidase domain-containing protein [Armatimonadota bacterium]
MGGVVSRRDFFRIAALGAAGLTGGALVRPRRSAAVAAPPHVAAPKVQPPPAGHGHDVGTVGEVDLRRAGVDPVRYLTHFDGGKVSRLPNGRTLREYRIVSHNREVEIAPGVVFPAWVYNGQVPGPTLRAREGDRIRVHYTNAVDHPHNIHFHGFHAAEMDGVEPIPKGRSFVYEFDAEPFGLHLYHCHVQPLKRHIHKGLYGVFIVDPPQGRPPARELVMMMNAFDTNFDGENEFYAVNTIPFYYARHPIRIRQDELVRVYLVNITEFDPINSMHLHANFFHVYPTGTSLTPVEFTDTVMLCQGQRAILEFRYRRPGRFMFHAHQSEFVELGWMSFFEVVPHDAA